MSHRQTLSAAAFSISDATSPNFQLASVSGDPGASVTTSATCLETGGGNIDPTPRLASTVGAVSLSRSSRLGAFLRQVLR